MKYAFPAYLFATLLGLLFSMPSHSLMGQNMKKFYYATPTPTGTLYFVLPQTFTLKDKTAEADHKMPCDFTYMSGSDSVRMLATIITQQPLHTDSLYIQCHHTVHGFKWNTIFKEVKRNRWVNRMEIYLPFKTWQEMFQLTAPPLFSIPQNGSKISYTLSSKKWKELSSKYALFFQMLPLNHPQ